MGFDYEDFYAVHKDQLKQWLVDKGFRVSPKDEDLLNYWYRDDDVTLFMDFRKTARRTYAFKKGADGTFKHDGMKLYLEYKDHENKLKDAFMNAESFQGVQDNDPLVAIEEEDMTVYQSKVVHDEMPPITDDSHEQILYHAANIIKAIQTHNLIHHYEKLNELLRKSGYKLRGE